MDEANEKIVSLFVEKEVLANMTDIVNYVFDTATRNNCPPFDPDSILPSEGGCTECGAPEEFLVPHTVVQGETEPVVNWAALPAERYECPICGAGYPDYETARDCCVGLELLICPECGHQVTYEEYEESLEVDIGSVKQWLLVTPWLAEKLTNAGEIVIPDQNIWVRTNDDDIAMDETILNICDEIGILKGQEHDWSKRICS